MIYLVMSIISAVTYILEVIRNTFQFYSTLHLPSYGFHLQTAIHRAMLPHSQYDSRDSQTFRVNGENIYVRYSVGNLTGVLSQDIVNVGDLNVTDHTFIEAIEIPQIFSTDF